MQSRKKRVFLNKNMLLGPCVNMSRNPFGGRNFESFGEDPFLTSSLAASYVRGIQGQHVLASVKHFALNEQEFERTTINVTTDLRAMFEVHFPAFKAAVDAGAWSVMASYNKVHGDWAAENDFLINRVLKSMWGFKGFVVSDWDATHSTVKAALAGLDLEMPTGLHFDQKLVDAVNAGLVPETLIDDKVRRILRAEQAIGLLGNARRLPPAKGPMSPEHQSLALKMAQDSIVLLKNSSDLLPLDKTQLKTVAVIGPNAKIARTGGGGSSEVIPFYTVSPLDGLKNRLGANVQVTFAVGTRALGDFAILPSQFLHPSVNAIGASGHASELQNGLYGEYFSNMTLTGPPLFSRIDKSIDFDFAATKDPRLNEHFSVRWTGVMIPPVTGTYQLFTKTDDGARLFLDDKELISEWRDRTLTTDYASVQLTAGQVYNIRFEYYQNTLSAAAHLGWSLPHRQNDLREAIAAAKAADVAVVFAGTSSELEGEGVDRLTMDLPFGQKELIRAVHIANPKTVVVINSGNPYTMDQWLQEVPAVLQAWYPGEEGGHAVADVLLGNVNPSAKLPITLLKKWQDSAAFGNYPGKNGEVNYAESIFIGYRHHDQANIEPNFPFGFGLSYTRFAFSDLQVTPLSLDSAGPKIHVEFTVTNTGNRAGAEVAQLYVGEAQPNVPRPVRELKGFQKVNLAPGQSQRVAIDLDSSAFSYFDVSAMRPKVNRGRFEISIGSSSRNLLLHSPITLL